MPNNFLLVGMFAAVGWVAVNAVPPSPKAVAVSSPVAATSPTATQAFPAASLSPVAARPPVPLVRAPRATASSSSDAPVAPPEPPKQDDLDKKAAKVAVEMDGYKRASILGKTSNGAWRAKAYRGTTEVTLIVDGTGRVSLE